MSTLKELTEELKGRFSNSEPARKPDHTEQNPIGLEQKKSNEIASELNKHQASMFVLFHQYQKHHWLVEGPQFRDLHLYLEDAYTAVHEELDSIAERMTVLGAIPTASPIALAQEAYIEHEPEGFFPIRKMLKHDLDSERAICVGLRRTIKEASDSGDYGTETLLKHILAKAEDRAHHLDHYLAEDGLRQ